jgi:hypothetical protein
MAQQGSIFESHGSWYLRWWEKVRQEDGFAWRAKKTTRRNRKSSRSQKSS